MKFIRPITHFTAAVLITGSLLAACSTVAPEPRPMPTLTYQKYPTIRLNVAQIQVVDNYTSTGQSPYIENQMAAPLPQVVHDWAAKRFQANGQDGTLVITINKASVTTSNLQRTAGLRGWVTVDQAEKLTGNIDVKFAVNNSSFGSSGSANVQSNAMRTVPENASLQQQDAILADLTEALIVELDAGSQRVFAEKLPTLMQQGGVMAPSGGMMR
jgi:hypothetical protein